MVVVEMNTYGILITWGWVENVGCGLTGEAGYDSYTNTDTNTKPKGG